MTDPHSFEAVVERLARREMAGERQDSIDRGWHGFKGAMIKRLAALQPGDDLGNGLVAARSDSTQIMRNAAVDATDLGAGMSWKNRSPQKVAATIYAAMIAAGRVKEE